MNKPKFSTKINLSDDQRSALIDVCNRTLATTLDLRSQVKQAHWNIKGPQFFARHELFDDLAKNLSGWSDDVAERAATLGGYARGTVRLASSGSALTEYDLDAVDGRQHIRALVDRYGTMTRQLRESLDSTSVKDDPVTEDLLTELLRGAELDLWFLESHIVG